MNIKSKLVSFLGDPLGGLLWRSRALDAHLRGRLEPELLRILNGWSKYQLRRRGLLDLLASRPAHAYPPDCVDLWFIYRLVREKKPRCILEFGSGCSTVILAQALFDNARQNPKAAGHLYSVDADVYWADVARQSMPAHLRELCDIWHSELLEADYRGTPVFRHARVPEIAPDFLYLDGPDSPPDRKVAIDVVDIEQRFHPGFCMVVDGRWANTLFLREHLKGQYMVNHHWPLEKWKTSIFELKTAQ